MNQNTGCFLVIHKSVSALKALNNILGTRARETKSLSRNALSSQLLGKNVIPLPCRMSSLDSWRAHFPPHDTGLHGSASSPPLWYQRFSTEINRRYRLETLTNSSLATHAVMLEMATRAVFSTNCLVFLAERCPWTAQGWSDRGCTWLLTTSQT